MNSPSLLQRAVGSASWSSLTQNIVVSRLLGQVLSKLPSDDAALEVVTTHEAYQVPKFMGMLRPTRYISTNPPFYPSGWLLRLSAINLSTVTNKKGSVANGDHVSNTTSGHLV